MVVQAEFLSRLWEKSISKFILVGGIQLFVRLRFSFLAGCHLGVPIVP